MDFVEYIPFEALFQSYGAAAVAWIIVLAESYALWKVVQWCIGEQAKWQALERERADKYLEVINRNTEVTTRHAVAFDLVTNELKELLRTLVLRGGPRNGS